jgi:hypothetical protein
MTWYDRAKEILKANNISASKVETATNLGQKSIYNWKSSCPSLDSVIKFVDYFDMSLDEFCERQKHTVNDLTDEERNLIKLFRGATDLGRGMAIGNLQISQDTLSAVG